MRTQDPHEYREGNHMRERAYSRKTSESANEVGGDCWCEAVITDYVDDECCLLLLVSSHRRSDEDNDSGRARYFGGKLHATGRRRYILREAAVLWLGGGAAGGVKGARDGEEDGV